MNVKRLFEISIIKTIWFNFHYFGMKSVFRPFVLCSRNVRIEKLDGVILLENSKFGCVRLGFKSVPLFDFKYVKFCWQNTGTISFGSNINIGQGCKISNSGYLHFGDNFNISANSSIVCRKRIFFDSDCLMSWNCLVMDSDWHRILDEYNRVLNPDKEVIIGKHVWIGCNSTLLKGTEIPNDSVIAAGSIISKKLMDSNVVYVGGGDKAKEKIIWTY